MYKVWQQVSRLPRGYWCRVKAVKGHKALIHDAHKGISFWVSFASLNKNWRKV